MSKNSLRGVYSEKTVRVTGSKLFAEGQKFFVAVKNEKGKIIKRFMHENEEFSAARAFRRAQEFIHKNQKQKSTHI